MIITLLPKKCACILNEQMEGNYVNQALYHVLLTGFEVPKPEVIFKLEQGEEPWMLEEETPHQSHAGE
jgi:hypothetical protein